MSTSVPLCISIKNARFVFTLIGVLIAPVRPGCSSDCQREYAPEPGMVTRHDATIQRLVQCPKTNNTVLYSTVY